MNVDEMSVDEMASSRFYGETFRRDKSSKKSNSEKVVVRHLVNSPLLKRRDVFFFEEIGTRYIG